MQWSSAGLSTLRLGGWGYAARQGPTVPRDCKKKWKPCLPALQSVLGGQITRCFLGRTLLLPTPPFRDGSNVVRKYIPCWQGGLKILQLLHQPIHSSVQTLWSYEAPLSKQTLLHLLVFWSSLYKIAVYIAQRQQLTLWTWWGSQGAKPRQLFCRFPCSQAWAWIPLHVSGWRERVIELVSFQFKASVNTWQHCQQGREVRLQWNVSRRKQIHPTLQCWQQWVSLYFLIFNFIFLSSSNPWARFTFTVIIIKC